MSRDRKQPLININGRNIKSWNEVSIFELLDYIERSFPPHTDELPKGIKYPSSSAVIKFAKRIVPSNWNVFSCRDKFNPSWYRINKLNSRKWKHEDSTVNVCIQFGPFDGDVRGQALSLFYEYSTAYAWIYLYRAPGHNWIATLLHELAHIAAYRYASRYLRDLRRANAGVICPTKAVYDYQQIVSNEFEKDGPETVYKILKDQVEHGEMFKIAYQWMISKVCKAFCPDY